MKTTIDLTQAIRDGILTFEQACALQGMSVEVSADKPEKPAKKTRKTRKQTAPKQDTPAPKQEAKAEEAPEYAYTKGGAIIQYGAKNTLKANHLRRVNNAIEKLVDAGFCVSWKRVGSWLYIYHDRKADHKTAAEFKAAKLAKGWTMIKGAWVDNTMLAGYEDNFR